MNLTRLTLRSSKMKKLFASIVRLNTVTLEFLGCDAVAVTFGPAATVPMWAKESVAMFVTHANS